MTTYTDILAPRPQEETDPFAFAEIKRIMSVPIQHPMDAAELEEFSRQTVLAEKFEAGFRLLPTQAEGLLAYHQCNAVFGRIPVGAGKTLISLMIANAAYAKGKTKILLCVPPNVLGQLVQTDLAWARARVSLNLPIHILGGRGMEFRKALALSNRKGLYIMPYSLLQTRDTSENLKAIAPDTIILDEAHYLANRSSARSKRMVRLIEETFPELVILSGTITRKSVRDYYHLIKPCLRQNCPLPLSDRMTDEWAQLIDADMSRDDAPSTSSVRPIMPLVRWAEEHFPNKKGGFPHDIYGFRRAYDSRLVTIPGVVSGREYAIGTSITLHNDPVVDYTAVEGWDRLKKYIDDVNEKWLTPNGDEIAHAIHTWKWLNELCGAGFYNELVWPTPEDYARRRRISLGEGTDILARAKIHHLAVQEYDRELRHFIESRHREGLDTPLLVGNNMARFADRDVPADLYRLWTEARALDFLGCPERDSYARRICPFKINAAVTWALSLPKGTGALLWVHHQEAGEWLYEKLIEAGLPAVHCPAGDKYNEVVRDEKNKDKMLVVSITAHGQGKNLQHFQEQYFLQWPRSAMTAEQALGRTHRTGQKADELVVWTNQTLLFDQLNFAACLNDSLYTHQTGGGRQKLIYANYDPLPKIFPPAVLVQKGLEVIKLDKRDEAVFTEKFGEFAK